MMKLFYSPTTKGFYDSAVTYSNLPDDLVEVSAKDYDYIHATLSKELKEIEVVDDKLVLVDVVKTLTWNNIKTTRNRLLSDSDYTQMPDYPGDKAAWATYRQQLRDITDTFSDPNEVVWPTKPNDK